MAVTTFMTYSEMLEYQIALNNLNTWIDGFIGALIKVKATYEIGALYKFSETSVANYFDNLPNKHSGMLVRYLGGSAFNEFYQWHLMTIHPDMNNFLALLSIIFRMRDDIGTALSSLTLYQ